jgi:signal transduction histidine kinase
VLKGALKLDLRLRIAIVVATLCIAVTSGLAATLYLAFEDMEDALVEQVVAEEMETLIQRVRTTGTTPASGPNLQYYVFANGDHEKLSPRLRALGPGHHEIGIGAEEKHIAVRDVDGNRYVVAYDSGQHEALVIEFKRLLLLAIGTTAVLAVLIGYGLAHMLTRQLTELADRVTKLAPDEPHPPLEHVEYDREVATLAHALDEYHARIVDMIQREQEFTANASHELRTPLTAIQTSCELLAAEPGLSEKARSRLGMVESAARQMTERLETLLFLTREHREDAAERVSLRSCVERVAAPFQDDIARKGLTLEIAIPGDRVVEVDRKALQLVLANLLKNAVRYTDRGVVRVSYDGSRLTVADSGSGIAAHHLPQVFERHYRADAKPEGLGLGLAIVRRICDDLGWKIEVESAPGAGSAFSVRLA